MEQKNIQDNGQIVCSMEEVNLYIKMVAFIKVLNLYITQVNGKEDYNMVQVERHIKINQFMKENLEMD